MRRIGIYSGSFDPVHAGHISFALQAIQAAQLDAVYFLPERRPRSKAHVEHFGHRVAMLEKATAPHHQLKVLELEDVSFTVASTLPRLLKRFSKAQLVFLLGSDVALQLPNWPNSTRLLKEVELIVGIRTNDLAEHVKQSVSQWPQQPCALTLFESHAASVSSRRVRAALRQNEYVPGLLKSVERYSGRNWLYVSLMQQKSQ